MKKIMIACAAVALAAVAQAASIDWSIGGGTWKDYNGSNAAKGTTVYLIDAAQWSTIETALKGGKDAFTTADAGILGVAATSNAKGSVAGTATSSQLTAGQSYDYAYLVVMDDKYFASGTMAKAAYDVLVSRIDGGVVVTKYDHVMGPIANYDCREAGHPVPDENSFSGTQAALDLVAAGVGITCLPFTCLQQREDLRYVPLTNWHQALYMCILYDKWLEPPVWDFVELLVKSLRDKHNEPIIL